MQGPPGGPTKIKECCKIPDIIPQDIFEKCEAENPKPDMMAGPPKGKFINYDQSKLQFQFTPKFRLLHE
jgi:hypothetical protein